MQTFDFLLAVTPINAEAAWRDFEASGFQRAPKLLYRPLTVQVDVEKKKLFSIAFDHFEDPVLSNLYREKQQELDLQLSMLSVRDTTRFVELSRALYGRVEPGLLDAAKDILAKTELMRGALEGEDARRSVDCYFLERAARSMIESYRSEHSGFERDNRAARRSAGRSDGFRSPSFDLPQHKHGMP